MHVVAGTAMPAKAARNQRMSDDNVADGNVLDSGTDSVHPAGILMAKRIRQFHVRYVFPLPLDDMKVGPTKPGAADAHDDIVRPGDFRVGNFFERRSFAVSMQTNCFHDSYFLCSV
jgi:hypothetical protein